jgi:hypothetical protein
MGALKSARHETFCQAIACGLQYDKAYRRAVGQFGGQPKHDKVHGYEWLKRKGVAERIEELRQENDRRAQMSRDQVLRFLSDVIRQSADKVKPGSWVIQSIKRSEDGTTVEIKLPDKVQCVAQMARMCNWNAGERITLEAGDSLTRYLAELRSKPIPIGHAVDVASSVKQLPEQSEQPSSAERDHEQ